MARIKPASVPRTIALCYVRRSWVRDDKDLTSPQMQREHVLRVCQQNNWTPEWYEDVDGHKSGMTEKNRPGWLALKKRLEDPDVAALVAYDLSRLHRKGWRISQLIDFVEQYGLRLVIADPARQIDFSSTYGRFFAQMSAIFDEYYALDISNRRKAQAAYKRKQNISSGIPPFGTTRTPEGRLIPSTGGCWYLTDGTWRAGQEGESAPESGAVWRGYYDCARRILDLYLQNLGAARICAAMRAEGWAFRGRNNVPVPLSNDSIRRVTKAWVEYGGIVIGTRAKDRNGCDLDPDKIHLDPDRAVFDVSFLKQVGEVSRSRSFRKTGRGSKLKDRPYPLSSLVYCAHCDQLARKQDNPRLRTHLLGRSKNEKHRGSYQHRNGVHCGCTVRQKSAVLIEGEFVKLCRHLTLSDDALAQLKHTASTLFGEAVTSSQDIEPKRTAAIAKCRKRLDAARHLYEDGELDRDAYLARKADLEEELLHWENYTIEVSQIQVQLALCVDSIARLVELWEDSSDEGRQTLARGLFEEIVFDLDAERIVDFKLKAWAQQFLLVRGYNSEAMGPNVPPAGIEPAPSPPEGDALSAELRGRKMPLILVGFPAARKPRHWKYRGHLRYTAANEDRARTFPETIRPGLRGRHTAAQRLQHPRWE